MQETPITEEKTLVLNKKFQRSFVSDAICDYTKARSKKRKKDRKASKAGRRANRGA